MDYNYIRMRNAAKEGNTELAEKYRQLYKSGKDIKEASHIIDYVLILLIVIAIGLGIYAVCYKNALENSASEIQTEAPAATETVDEEAVDISDVSEDSEVQ